MSLMNTLTDFPLKSPTAELLFYENPVSTLLYEIRTSESHYRDQLSKLLGCCSPLKRQAANGFTNSVRKLIAYHTDLVRSLDHADEIESVLNFIDWVKSAIPVYQNYVHNYSLDVNSLKAEVSLKKAPLIRINQMSKYFQKIVDINDSHPESKVDFDELIQKNLNKLMEMARDKNEMENLRIDLSTLLFDKVHSLDSDYYNTVGYFQLDQCVKRDYFKFDLLHPKSKLLDVLVEVFQLTDGTIAICSVESVGRSLMFPPLKASEFAMVKNNLDLIHLSNDDGVELKLTCPDKSQLSYWNNVIDGLFGSEQVGNEESKFNQSHYKLQQLKNQKLGLGIKMEENQSLGSLLRKSSPILSKHPSLNVGNSSPIIPQPSSRQILSDVSPKLSNIDQYFAHDVDLNKLNTYTIDENEKVARNKSITPRFNTVPKSTTAESFSGSVAIAENAVPVGTPSPTLPLNIKKSSKTTKLKLEELPNSSTVSLPNFQESKPLLNINEKLSGSSVDLSKFDNIKPNLKAKKRRSIFNLFSKKLNDEPEFEIVTKPSDPIEPQSSSSTESNETITKPKQSMASLQKNVKKLTIATNPPTTTTSSSTSSLSATNESPLPSPFGSSSKKKHTLTPLEETTLANSTVVRVLKNNTIVSQWSQSHWESIGGEYQHTVKFLSTPQGRVFVLYSSDDSTIPELMIPTEGATVSKSSALDLQIRCFNAIKSKRLIMLNVRVKEAYTLKLVMNEFENKGESISASNSDVFSAPSNSTSMSSISVNEIQELGKPGAGVGGGSVYKTNGQSGSNSSLQSSSHTKTLLLKGDVKIKLHKMDEDEEWRPFSLGKFNISSNLGNPEYSKFELNCANDTRIETVVKNSTCSRIGRSGLRFGCIDEVGDEVAYLIEFRNSRECVEIYEMLI